LYGGEFMRTAEIERKTNETEIRLRLKLDGSGEYLINTGVGFFDHMLSHVVAHGLFDLELEAEGDLHIDNHHVVEDCALVLGQAFDQALGDRRGITRMGSAYVPMDEALAFVAIDLSGRPYAVVDAEWHAPAVGGVATSLFPHVLESFAASARCNLHARVLYGRDDHHQAEALFKALGRALDIATSLDPRRGYAVPSTKGTLT
jgi:imidazoleglycerol-phosphate dehydratase